MKKKLNNFLLKKETAIRDLNFYLRSILFILTFVMVFKEKFYLSLLFLMISNSTHLFDMYLESISKRLLLKVDLKDFLLESITITGLFALFLYKKMIGILNTYIILTLIASLVVLSLVFYFRTKGVFIPKTGKLHLMWAAFMFTSYFYLLQSFFSEIMLFFVILFSYFYAVPSFLIYILRMKKNMMFLL